MAPRGTVLPPPATESAREARKAFFCELCQKGYARMNDFEAHEGSYDHQHRKRLKDMRHLSRDPNATAKARAAEQKANEDAGLKSISLVPASAPGTAAPKKKPVFKSTLQPHVAAALGAEGKPLKGGLMGLDGVVEGEDASGAVRNGWVGEAYLPRFVTGCEEVGCRVCEGGRVDLGGGGEEVMTGM